MNFEIVEEKIVVEGKELVFYHVKCKKCGNIVATYADKKIAEYSAKYWLKCCD